MKLTNGLVMLIHSLDKSLPLERLASADEESR